MNALPEDAWVCWRCFEKEGVTKLEFKNARGHSGMSHRRCQACGQKEWCHQLFMIHTKPEMVDEGDVYRIVPGRELQIEKASPKVVDENRKKERLKTDALMREYPYWSIVNVEIRKVSLRGDKRGEAGLVRQYVVTYFPKCKDDRYPQHHIKTHESSPPDLEKMYLWDEIECDRMWINGTAFSRPPRLNLEQELG